MKFELKIDSDNDDNGPDMVIRKLEDVAERVLDGQRSGTLRDGNGNLVGSWGMSES